MVLHFTIFLQEFCHYNLQSLPAHPPPPKKMLHWCVNSHFPTLAPCIVLYEEWCKHCLLSCFTMYSAPENPAGAQPGWFMAALPMMPTEIAASGISDTIIGLLWAITVLHRKQTEAIAGRQAGGKKLSSSVIRSRVVTDELGFCRTAVAQTLWSWAIGIKVVESPSTLPVSSVHLLAQSVAHLLS